MKIFVILLSATFTKQNLTESIVRLQWQNCQQYPLDSDNVREKYRQEALSPVHVDNGDVKVPFCLLPVTLVSNIQ
jgi:hypothetical protein